MTVSPFPLVSNPLGPGVDNLNSVIQYINGVLVPAINAGGGSGTGGATTTRLISSGTTDTALANDVLIAWNSGTTGAKAQTIGAPTTKGQTLIIKDEVGTANTYNITITPTAGTVDGAANLVLNGQYESVNLVADGTSNWMVT